MTMDGTITVLHTFSGVGRCVEGLTEAADGTFYGTTDGSFSETDGTVFHVDGTLTVLHYLANNTDGAAPAAPLGGAADGSFYGTAPFGGSAGFGTVFSVTSDGAFSVQHSFTGGSEGGFPGRLLQASDGRFYGTTYDAQLNLSLIFRLTIE